MRIFYPDQLKSGMKLGLSIYDKNLRLLLKSGAILDSRYIDLIKQKDVKLVFVEDELFDGLTITPIVSDKVKYITLSLLEEFYVKVVSKIPTFKKNFYERCEHAIRNKFIKQLPLNELKEQIENIVYDIESADEEHRFFSYYNYNRNFTEINFDIMIVSILIGFKLGYPRTEILQLAIAALLHDIGWIFSPVFDSKNFIVKEFDFKNEDHVVYGYRFLRESKHLTALEYIPAYEHHELCDGTGFPNKKISDFSFPDRMRREVDNQIFRLSEVISVVSEVFNRADTDQISSVLNRVKEQKKIKYNSYVIEALDCVLNPFPQGSLVELITPENEENIRGVVMNNTIPGFFPTIRTEKNKDIPVEETSKFNINVI